MLLMKYYNFEKRKVPRHPDRELSHRGNDTKVEGNEIKE